MKDGEEDEECVQDEGGDVRESSERETHLACNVRCTLLRAASRKLRTIAIISATRTSSKHLAKSRTRKGENGGKIVGTRVDGRPRHLERAASKRLNRLALRVGVEQVARRVAARSRAIAFALELASAAYFVQYSRKQFARLFASQ